MTTKNTITYVLIAMTIVLAIGSAIVYNQEAQELDTFRFYDEIAFKQWIRMEKGYVFLAETNNPDYETTVSQGVELWHYVIALSEPYLDYENDYLCMLLTSDEGMVHVACIEAASATVISGASGTEKEIREALKDTPLYHVERVAIEQAIMRLYPWDLPDWYVNLPHLKPDNDQGAWAIQWAEWLIALVMKAT
jgi:hypothetical protein